MAHTRLKVGVFHPGTQHSWQTALAFQESGQLGWYATSLFYDPRRWPYRIENYLPRRFSQIVHCEFARRDFPALKPENVRQFGLSEWMEIGAHRLGAARLKNWINRRGNRLFGEPLIDLIRREPVDVLWGYNNSSLQAFRWAKQHGIRCMLDQTVGHCVSMNRALLAERERHPEFFLNSYQPYTPEEIAQQDEEIGLADTVVAGSDFCADTLIENGCPAAKIRVVPYGFDEDLFPLRPSARATLRGRPCRFLFVGALNPRKGIAPLLKAFQSIPTSEASLTLLGRMEIPEETFGKFAGRVTHIAAVPRNDVAKYYVQSDCFIFPSLFEGSALALYEAVGADLGIIQSASAGVGVQAGKNGVILDEVTEERIVSAVRAVTADPERLMQWQQMSCEMRQALTWKQYHQRVRATLES
jgi:glycosyltransferase involved in cell wall biosynthesis